MVSFYLRDKQAKRRTVIGAYIFHNGERLYFSTKIQIPPDRWDETRQRATTGRGFTAGFPINIRLDEIKELLENAYYSGKATNTFMDRQYFLNVLDRPEPKKVDFFSAADSIVKSFFDTKQYRYSQSIGTQITKFRDFIGQKYPDHRKGLDVANIDLKMLKGFKVYLTRIGNNPNTIKTTFKKIKMVYDSAVAEIEDPDTRTRIRVNNPFDRLPKIKEQKTNKVRLTAEQVRNLKDCELTPGSMQWHARNLWLFSYYTAGIRAGDVMLLKKENFDLKTNRYYYLIGKTERTNAIEHSMIMIPEAREILDLYLPGKKDSDLIFPFIKQPPKTDLDKIDQINRGSALWRKFIAQVAEKAGLPRIGPHTARHSFADQARRAKANPYGLKQALRHSSLEVTQKYLNQSDTADLDQAVRQTFGYGEEE